MFFDNIFLSVNSYKLASLSQGVYDNKRSDYEN